jgi:hypothetical protein
VPIRAEDLPPAVRKRIEAQTGQRISSRTRPKKSRAGTSENAGGAGRCGCGERFERYAMWLKHRGESGVSGHGRWEIDID